MPHFYIKYIFIIVYVSKGFITLRQRTAYQYIVILYILIYFATSLMCCMHYLNVRLFLRKLKIYN